MMAYDFERMLALDGLSDKAVGSVSRAAMRDDGTCEIRYSCNAAAFSEGGKWLRENRLTISDMEIGGVPLEGLWRTVGIQGQEERDRGGNVTGAFLVVRMAKGYYEAWNWEAVRVRQGELKHGNDTTVDGVAIGNSELYQRQAVLTLPYVTPAQAQATAETLTDTAYTGLVAGGVTFAGVWFNMGATFEEGEDGTASVSLRLGRPQYTIEGYRGHGTWDREQSYYVSNVPQTRAQAVMNAWRTVDGTPSGAARLGASASIMGGVNTDANTVNIILTAPDESEKLAQRVSSSETCFEEQASTTDLHQAARRDQPAFVRGVISSVTSVENPEGTFDNTTDEREAKIGETPEHVVRRLHNGVVEEARRARHLDPDSLPAWAVEPPTPLTIGTGLTIQRSTNEFCGVGVERQEVTATEVRRPAVGEHEIVTRDGTIYEVEYDNVTPVNLADRLTALDARTAHHRSAQITFSPVTGTYDLRMRANPQRGSGTGLQAFSETWTGYQWAKKISGGQLLRQLETYEHGSMLTTTRSTARTFIHEEGSPSMRQFKHGDQTWYHASYQTLTDLSAFSPNETTVPT